ncbi:MAG: hypothetical protein ACFE8A_01225 [Candidatus Hodarchaeota archaeon]
MIIKTRYRRQIKCIVLLSIILTSLIGALILPTIPTNSPAKLAEKIGKSEEIDNLDNIIDVPKLNDLGNDTWWDESYSYRRIINITNPYAVNFTNYGAKLTFNYQNLGIDKIQGDLDDIRIVEYYNGEPVLRDYYVVKDYPDPNYATVWFDTNITEGPNHTEQDTYIYYGNPVAQNAESRGALESFGYVRNGDFEHDISEDTKFIPYGWNFTDDPIDKIQDGYLSAQNINNEPYNNTVIPDSWENFQYRLVTAAEAEGYEGVGNGDYAYKFGNKANSLPNTQTLDYVGTFYSFPFKVPIIEGAGVTLNLWRNAHTYIFMPSNQYLDYDGYYIRVCNGSSFSHDVDAHEDATNVAYENYVEIYGGNARYSARWRQEYELRAHPDEVPIKDTRYDLVGATSINLSAYMGQDIFIEIGSWGREDGDPFTATKDYRGGFFQIDNVKFNYTLTGILDEQQAVDNQVTIVAVDVDGRIVPNVEIFIVNNSAPGQPIIVNSSNAEKGVKTFTKVPRGKFNITANYTLASGQTVEVFNSSTSGDGPYYFNGINYTVQIQLDIWTIDFEIVDWDKIPLSLGYIEIRDKGGTWLRNVTLDSNGKATFRWLNDSRYYYKVWYKNDDYGLNPTALNASYVDRSNYILDNVKTTHHSINVNETQTGSYLVNETIYTNYSSEIANKKINKAVITLTDMDDYLEDISVYYIDKDDSAGTGNEHRIYYKQYPTPPDDVQDDVIEIDISTVDNANLYADNYEVYGLLIEVNGFNSSDSNGIIQVDLTETCNVYNKTELARLNIKTVYYSDLEKDFVAVGALVHVNTSGIFSLVNLSSNAEAIPPLQNGYAYGQINEVPLWYKRGWTYNFTIDVANETYLDFNVTINSGPIQWTPDPAGLKEYNYTLWENSTLTFCVIPPGVGFNFTKFITILNASYSTGSVEWGDSILIWAIFLYSEDGGITWYPVTSSQGGTCRVVIKLAGTETILFNIKMQYGSGGNYSKIIDSSKLSAGTSAKNYIFEIRGFHPTYDDPTPLPEYVEIKAVPTIMKSYDYDTRGVLSDNLYSQNFGEIVKILVAYNISASGVPLTDPLTSVSYSWAFGSGTLNPDPVDNDYYYTSLNTSIALSTGIKLMTVTATLENYSMAQITAYIYVLERATFLSLDGGANQTGLIYSSEKVWIKDDRLFTFDYRDSDKGNRIGDVDLAEYTWQETTLGGVPIAGSNGVGALTENADNSYTLDFNTGGRKVGFYYLYVTINEENYETRTALINLEIRLRTFDSDLDANNYEDDQVTVVHGEKIELEITLVDESRGIPLDGAVIELDIGGKKYDFERERNGVYTLTYETDDIEAFFTSKTMTGEITIEKEDFVSDEIEITFVITMEEIFDGMPTFYFIMIVSSISAVVGALVGYRVIQQARIPKFVKKVRTVKKAIKSKSSVPSISIPSKNKMFMKELGKEWSDLGISLRDVLGIEEKKVPILSKVKDLKKQKGGDK